MKKCVYCKVNVVNNPRRKLCDACFSNKKSVYMKIYRMRHPDIDGLYYENNRDVLLRKLHEYRTENKDLVNEQQRIRYAKNPLPAKANALKYFYDNYDRCRERNSINLKAWQRNNKQRASFLSLQHIMRRNNVPGFHTFDEWNDLILMCCGVCPACGNVVNLQEDHIIAPGIGGTDYINNIQPLCKSCNTSKRQKIILYQRREEAMLNLIEFANKTGMQIRDEGSRVIVERAEEVNL